jgi:DNA replication and repair protein RecF
VGLVHLEISKVRNLNQVHLHPGPGFNIFYGQNGSGKTSLLEAIYILGRGKSFRSSYLKQVVMTEQGGLTVFGRIEKEGGSLLPLGVEFSESQLRMRVAGQSMQKASELARHLPLLVINPDSHQLISEGPELRRQFMDWGVFHVEHRFFPAWQRYFRALKQRNAALRLGMQASPGLESAWDAELTESAGNIDAFRKAYIERLTPVATNYVQKLLADSQPSLNIRYMRGWPADENLKSLLSNGLQEDRALGYTRYGPHRADLRVYYDGMPARETCSRGEQKLLICAFYLAQAALFKEITGLGCVILMDDLGSELDPRHRHTLLSLLDDIGAQTFITSTELEALDNKIVAKAKVFHVEHGVVKEVFSQ